MGLPSAVVSMSRPTPQASRANTTAGHGRLVSVTSLKCTTLPPGHCTECKTGVKTQPNNGFRMTYSQP